MFGGRRSDGSTWLAAAPVSWISSSRVNVLMLIFSVNCTVTVTVLEGTPLIGLSADDVGEEVMLIAGNALSKWMVCWVEGCVFGLPTRSCILFAGICMCSGPSAFCGVMVNW